MRMVQEFLGHESVTTTQDYVDVDMVEIKRVQDERPSLRYVLQEVVPGKNFVPPPLPNLPRDEKGRYVSDGRSQRDIATG
jgi:hypothetical protein